MPPETSIRDQRASQGTAQWPLTWLSATALDAPLVCVGWFLLIATERGDQPPVSSGVILGLSVWLAYMADRWFDGFRLPRPGSASFRHRFAHTNRSVIALVWILVLMATLTYALHDLPASTLRRGTGLLVIVLAYFGAIHLGPRCVRQSAPKEFVTALILTAGILLFLPRTGTPHSLMGALIALFFANCVLIDIWESGADRPRNRRFLSHRVQSGTGWTRLLLAGITGLAACASGGFCETGLRTAWSAAGLSAVLLFLLDLTRQRWSPPSLRAMADIVLMTPWILLLFLRR